MNHIRSFKEYKDIRINEELIGNLFKGLKNKISLEFSKMFGSADKANKIIEEYKKELSKLHSSKLLTLKAYGEYLKIDNKDKSKENQLLKNIDEASKKFDEQIKLVKQKFDIKFNEIVEEEKNKKIQNYINLKKIEMQQEFLAKEVKSLLTDSTDEKELDPKAKEIIDRIKNDIKKSQELQESQKRTLELEEEKEIGFDIDKAKEMARNGDVYQWEGSPLKNYKFENGDRIKFFSNTNKKETKAIVIEDLGDKIKIKTENHNEIEINKLSIISSDNYERKSKNKKSK